MRALVLTHRLPYAPNRGDRVRAFHTLCLLAGRMRIALFSLAHSDDEERHGQELSPLVDHVRTIRVSTGRNVLRAAAALPGSQPLTHVLLDAPGLDDELEDVARRWRPDVVLAYCSGMARLALHQALGATPFVLDMVDVDSAKWAALAETAAVPWRWVYAREAWRLRRFEALAVKAASMTFVVNDRERRALSGLVPHGRIAVAANGVDVEGLRPPEGPPASANVVFCGVMNYAPNEQGALWLSREVWPLVRARRPDATLTLVGADPTRAIRAVAAHDPSIAVTGTVPDVRPYLWRAAVAAAPLHIARGVQNKVLEAVAAGLPVVVTPAVVEGLPADVLPACSIAGAAEAFAAQLVGVLERPPQERRVIVSQANLGGLEWRASLEPIAAALEDAVRHRTPASREGADGRLAEAEVA